MRNVDVSAICWWTCPCGWRGHAADDIARHLRYSHGEKRRSDFFCDGFIEDWFVVSGVSWPSRFDDSWSRRVLVGAERNRVLLDFLPKIEREMTAMTSSQRDVQRQLAQFEHGLVSKEQMLTSFDMA